MKIRRIDHVSIVVNDLSAAKEFFTDLGLQVVGEADVEGEWVDRVVGLRGVKGAIVMLRTKEGGANIELVKFHSPPAEQAEQGMTRSAANVTGIRHIAFVVEDVEATVAKLKRKGTELIGEIVNYENVYKVCYVRGPEGIILELAQELQ